jgi:hypothetical protein
MTTHVRTILALGVGLTTAVVAHSTAQASYVQWDTANAIAGGSACNAQGPFADTWFIAAGEDVSVIFSRMGIDLTPSTTQNTQVHSCLVRIPITVDGAVMLATLSQRLHWGYAKDINTEAEVHASGSIFNYSTVPISAYLPPTFSGVDAWRTESTSTSVFTWPWCGMDHTGLLNVNLSIAARRVSNAYDISVRIFGEDIRYDVTAVWIWCP